MQKQAPLYQYKIDVVGFKDETIDLIELKQSATMRAIGQVNGYTRLYIRDFSPPEPPRQLIITDALMPEMTALAADAGVILIVV
jgi:hypothetical protein